MMRLLILLLLRIVATVALTTEANSKESSTTLLDERTLLDTFGEIAKEFLTQKVIPPTDRECQWDWRTVRCEPVCNCHFATKRGDYHLGRACRLRPEAQQETCDLEALNEHPHKSIHRMIQQAVRTSQLVKSSVEGGLERGYLHVQSRVCNDLPNRNDFCSKHPPLLAWQEKLFCKDQLPTCDDTLVLEDTTSS